MAIWHAGQVLRAVERLMPAQLRDFYAVAIYYASMALWIYGVMLVSTEESHPSAMLSKHPSDDSIDRLNQISLKELETTYIIAFRANNQGIPGLAMRDNDQVVQFVPITSAARVLEYPRDIYRRNYSRTDKPLPPLHESLGSLMTELSSLPGSPGSRMATEVVE